MNLGDTASDLAAEKDPDVAVGLAALRVYWQQALILNPEIPGDFSLFLDGLKQALTPKSKETAWPGYPASVYFPNSQDRAFVIKVAGIGNMINVGGQDGAIDSEHVQNAMHSLAAQGGGRVPADFNSFVAVLQDQAAQVNFFDAAWYTVKESAAQIAEGAEQIGGAVLDTGAMILKYKNYLLVAAALAAAFYFYKQSDTLLGMFKTKKNPEAKPAREKRWKTPSKVASLMFEKSRFSVGEATAWAIEHGFAAKKIDDSVNYWRIRQSSPTFFKRFRVIEFGEKLGIKAAIGYPKKSH